MILNLGKSNILRKEVNSADLQVPPSPKIKREEYRKVINLLNKDYAIRDVAKLTGKGISTVQRVKKEFVA